MVEAAAAHMSVYFCKLTLAGRDNHQLRRKGDKEKLKERQRQRETERERDELKKEGESDG